MAKSLDMIQKGVVPGAKKIVLYGPEGVGKSTWASHAPRPVYVGAERGSKYLDVARIPAAELKHWGDVLDWLYEFRNPRSQYQTLVIDTLDWLELWLHVSMPSSTR